MITLRNISAGARAAILAGLLILLVASAIGGEYGIANWRANQAVENSQQVLCSIINLVTAHPVPKPVDPAQNPSRVASYQLYQDFVIVGTRYHC